MTTIGEVCAKPQYGWTTKGVDDGEVHLLRTTDITSGAIDWTSVPYCDEAPDDLAKYVLKDGDIVISRAGSVGYSYLVRNPELAVFASYLIRFQPLEVDRRYFAYYLQSPTYWNDISESKLGIAVQNVNASKLRLLEIPLAPLAEQRRIVDAIEAHFTRLDAAVDALQHVQANLKRYRASVLKAACEGRLVPTEADLAAQQDRPYEPASALLQRILAERRAQWEAQEWDKLVEKGQKEAAQAARKAAGRPAKLSDLDEAEWQDLPETAYAQYLPKTNNWKQKYQEPPPPDTSDLPDLPEGWTWATAQYICDPITNGTTPKHPKVKTASGEIPFLKTHNVTMNGSLNFLDRPHFIDEDVCDTELRRSVVQPGDVLLNTVGPPIGKAAVVPNSYRKWNINQNLTLYRVIDCMYLPGFLCYWLHSPNAKLVIEYLSTATAGQYYLNLGNCRLLPVPICTVSEQTRIVTEVERRLSIADGVEYAVSSSMQRAERLRQAILKRAFEGKLVPQDPNDEPASELLDRIRRTRAGYPVQDRLL